MSGNFIFVSLLTAFVALIGLKLWLNASVEITRLDPTVAGTARPTPAATAR